MNEIKLKRCPFCGGEAELDIDDLGIWFVRCKKCFCRTSRSMSKFFPTVAWNTRKPMQEIVERLEERRKNLNEEGKCLSAEMVRQDVEIVKEVGGMNE